MSETPEEEIRVVVCPTCSAQFKRKKSSEETHPLYFCAYCGTKLRHELHKDKLEKKELVESATVVSEHLPKPEEIQGQIGQYQILKRIGKGGMGEVFLAYDTVCGRKIALKRIRADLVDFPQIQKRFLREARITAQLIHPAIIPIYSINCEEGLIYYSMPYVEGNTLKQLLRRAFDHERSRSMQKDVQGSIPFLIRHFLGICQAVAYAHSKGVLHRDVKPENIIVGTYGEVHILDWGLAKALEDDEALEVPEKKVTRKIHITRLGKVVGTIAYMAPERAQGAPASVQTDIYSLGVILYQILTLMLPFRRKSLASFKKTWKKEQFIPPEVMAPYRDVPEVLSQVVRKCLTVNPFERYQSVDALIHGLESYLEGRSEWLKVTSLDTERKEDWLFQENILLAELTAITRAPVVSDWVSLMVSKDGFTDNTKVEAKVSIGTKGSGIAFLLSVPEAKDVRHVRDGYSLWLAPEQEPTKTTQLSLASVVVLEAPEIVLKRNVWYSVRIEKIERYIHFYLNDQLQFSYASHIPVVGTHIGLLSLDADFEVKDITVSVGSQNIDVSCLAVPDAFLARKLYDDALHEYRRIGTVFPGRQEGREALFRAGMTLLEQAKNPDFATERADLLERALVEFGMLRKSPGAPLEYLGKAFVYKELKDYEEEAKCYELCVRRYKNHPLLPIVDEQIVFRMHESSKQNRVAAYHFICLVARFIPSWAERPPALKLFDSLQKSWEIPPFMQNLQTAKDAELKRLSFCLAVAFWLAKPWVIAETIEEIVQRPIVAIGQLSDGIFSLCELGAFDLAQEKMKRIREVLSETEQQRFKSSLDLLNLLITSKDGLPDAFDWISPATSLDEERVVCYFLRKAIDNRNLNILPAIENKISVPSQRIDALLAEYYLYHNLDEKLETLFAKYAKESLLQESSPLYFVYGCYIAKQEGIQSALKHFSRVLDIAFPRTPVLAAHFLARKIHMSSAGWFEQSFMWERRSLYQQLALFWHVAQDKEKEMSWYSLIAREYADG